MGRSAAIGFPFIRIGLVPDFGISHTLALRIGPAAAKQEIATGMVAWLATAKT